MVFIRSLDPTYCDYFGVFIEKHVYTEFLRDWFLCQRLIIHAHLYPYRSVLPEVVHCCFTGTTMFTKILMFVSSEL